MENRSLKAKANYIRICHLLVDKTTNALRNALHAMHTPSTLASVLNANKKTLRRIRYSVIKDSQWDLLFPTSGSPDSNNFDITLLTVLLQRIRGLSAPATDTSMFANILRVQMFRDEVCGHIPTAGLDDVTFETMWKKISVPLVNMGILQNDIDELKVAPLSPEEESYIERLKEWKHQDDDIMSKLSDFESEVHNIDVYKDSFVRHKIPNLDDHSRLVDFSQKIDKTPFEKSNYKGAEEFKNLDITQHRLIFDGPLTWRLTPTKHIDLHALLLEDLLVLLQKQDDKYVLKCQSISITGYEDDKTIRSPVLKLSALTKSAATDEKAFLVVGTFDDITAQIYELVAATNDERETWLKYITEAIEFCKGKTVERRIRNAVLSTMKEPGDVKNEEFEAKEKDNVESKKNIEKKEDGINKENEKDAIDEKAKFSEKVPKILSKNYSALDITRQNRSSSLCDIKNEISVDSPKRNPDDVGFDTDGSTEGFKKNSPDDFSRSSVEEIELIKGRKDEEMRNLGEIIKRDTWVDDIQPSITQFEKNTANQLSGANDGSKPSLVDENISFSDEVTTVKHRKKIMLLKAKDCNELRETKIPLKYFSKDKALRIGKGSPGTHVHVGLTEDGREVAVKRILKETSDILAQNELEIFRLIENIRSPYIVNYWYFDSDDLFMYLVLDLCEENLNEYVVETCSLEYLRKHGVRMIKEILLGLQVLHDRGILHRDLKPLNILVSVDGRMQLADFGISRVLNDDETTALTEAKGTDGWIPPEVINVMNKKGSKGPYKRKSDVHVAGMIAFFILTKGEHPFGPRLERMSNISKGEPISLNKVTALNAQQFISELISHNIEHRPYVKDALKHCFFSSQSIVHDN